MTPSRQQAKATLRRLGVFGFGKNTPSAGDHSVRCEHKSAGLANSRNDRVTLADGQTKGVVARALRRKRMFVDFGRFDPGGLDADLTKKVQPPWR
jgi:hypothetical protein